MAKVYSIEKVKNLFTKVSLSDQYKLEIKIDDRISPYINNKISGETGIPVGPDDIYNRGDGSSFGGLDEKVSVMCRATQIPGVSIDYETLIGARQGIAEIFPTYRKYTALDCTFYVDKDHDVLRFFNRWMNMINPIIKSNGDVETPAGFSRNQKGTSEGLGISNRANFYQINYKDNYVTDITLTKFEKDSFGNQSNRWRPNRNNDTQEVDGLTYTFYRAFPVDIIATPLSYDGPDIFQVSVTFEYERYSVS